MLQRRTADSCSVLPPGALGPFLQSCFPVSWSLDYPRCRTQYLPLLNIMKSCIPVGTDAHFAHTIVFALLQIQFSACTCIHQVYRFIDTFCQFFLLTASWFPESNKLVKFLNFTYMQGDFSQNNSNDKPLCQVGFCFVCHLLSLTFPILR